MKYGLIAIKATQCICKSDESDFNDLLKRITSSPNQNKLYKNKFKLGIVI